METSLREHQSLVPLYVQLASLVRTSVPAPLTRPGRKNLAKAQVPDLPAMFTDIARAAGVQLVGVAPQVRPPQGAGSSLVVVTRVHGSFPAFREYLMRVGRHPAVLRTSKATIRKADMGEELELEVWMGVD